MREDLLQVLEGTKPLTNELALTLTTNDLTEAKLYAKQNNPVGACMLYQLNDLLHSKFILAPHENPEMWNTKVCCLCDKSTNKLLLTIQIIGFIILVVLAALVPDGIMRFVDSVVLTLLLVGILHVANDDGDYLSIDCKGLTISQTYLEYRSRVIPYKDLSCVIPRLKTTSIFYKGDNVEFEVPVVITKELADYINTRIINERK